MTHRINIKHSRGDNSKKPMSLPDLSTLGLDIGTKGAKGRRNKTHDNKPYEKEVAAAREDKNPQKPVPIWSDIVKHSKAAKLAAAELQKPAYLMYECAGWRKLGNVLKLAKPLPMQEIVITIPPKKVIERYKVGDEMSNRNETFGPPGQILERVKKSVQAIDDEFFMTILASGNTSQTEYQKLFAIEYFEFLVNRYLGSTNICSDQKPADLSSLFENAQNDDVFQKAITEALEKITCEDEEFKKSKDAVIRTLVSVELSLPMYHCFTGMVGASYEFGTMLPTPIPVGRMFLLHPIHSKSAVKTLERKEEIINYYKEHGSLRVPCSNVSVQGIWLFNFFVVTEGNGRLAALKAAIHDLGIEAHANTIIADVAQLNTQQSDDVWKMVCVVWASAFPSSEPPPGWKHPMPIRFGPISEVPNVSTPTKSDIEHAPFNYGFVPFTSFCPAIKITS